MNTFKDFEPLINKLTNRLCFWFREKYPDHDAINNVDPVVWVAALSFSDQIASETMAGMARMLAGNKIGFSTLDEGVDYIRSMVIDTMMVDIDYTKPLQDQYATAWWDGREEENLWANFSSIMRLSQEITECPQHILDQVTE